MNKLLRFLNALALTALVFAPSAASGEKITRHTDSEGWEEWYWTTSVTVKRGQAHTFWIKDLTETTEITGIDVYCDYTYKEDGETYGDSVSASESTELRNSKGGYDKYVLLTANDWDWVPESKSSLKFTVRVEGWGEDAAIADLSFTFGHSDGDGLYPGEDEYIDYYLSNPPFDDPDIRVFEQKNVLLGYTVTNETAVVRGVVSYNFKTRKVLTSCSIPSKVDGYPIVELAPGAFLGRDDLLSVYIPVSVTKLDGALDGCVQLKSVTVADGNANFMGKGSCLFSKDGKTLIAAPSARGCFAVPDTVETIATRAFAGSPVERIVVPESVTRIETEAFADCDSLQRVIFCGDVPETDGAAFSNCTATAYYHYDFADYWEDDEIWSEDVVSKEYGTESFDGIIWKFYLDGASAVLGTWEGGRTVSTSKLTGARTLPTTLFGFPVNYIGDGAFDKCTKLTELTVPASILGIGDEAFSACSSLTNVVFDGDEPVTGADLFLDCSDQLTVRVPLEGVDWTVEIPGIWQDVRIAYRPSYDSSLTVSADVPNGKIFSERQTVSLSAVDGLEIYYTLDGTSYDLEAFDYTPTGTPIKYAGPFEVTDDVHVRYWAFDPVSGNWGRLGHLQLYLDLAEEGREYEMEERGIRYGYVRTDGGVELRSAAMAEDCRLHYPTGLVDLTLPATVGGLPVRSIASLDGLTADLVRIVLPEGVTEIADSLFDGFGLLSEVVLPSTIDFIGGRAFYGCESLTSLDVPAGLTRMSPWAFEGSYLQNVRFHGDAPVIGEYDQNSGDFVEDGVSTFVVGECELMVFRHPFRDWSHSATFWGGAISKDFACHVATGTVSGVDWTYSCCGASGPIGLGTLTGESAVPTNVAGVVSVPASVDGRTVTAILPDAFRGCDGISAFVADGLSNYVTAAGAIYAGSSAETADELVYWPNAAEAAEVKDGVSSVGDKAFCGCRHLHDLTLPASVSSISEAAIADCHELTNITLAAGGRYFKRGDAVCEQTEQVSDATGLNTEQVVLWPRGLRDVTVPDAVVGLGDAFVEWPQLRSLTAETTDGDCFRCFNGGVLQGCTGLEYLSVPVIPDDSVVYGFLSYAGQRLANFFATPFILDADSPIPASLREVRVLAPDDYMAVSEGCFADARGLETVTLGSGMGAVHFLDGVFVGCDALRDVNVRSGDICTESQTFDGCTGVVMRPVLDDRWIESHGRALQVSLQGPGVSDLVITDNLDSLVFDFPESPDFERLVFVNDYPLEENGSVTPHWIDDEHVTGVVRLNPFARRDENQTWCGLPVENATAVEHTVDLDGVSWTYSTCGDRLCIGTLGGDAAIPRDTTGLVTIPARIGGTPVGKVLAGAFTDCPNVTAFALTEASESLSVANGVLLSGDGSELLRVPEGATAVTVPGSVTSISADAFVGCDCLTTVSVDPGCAYSVVDGILLSEDGTALVLWPRGRGGDVVLPESVTRIGSSLMDWAGLRSLTMLTGDGNGFASGGNDSALAGCTNLVALTIPSFPCNPCGEGTALAFLFDSNVSSLGQVDEGSAALFARSVPPSLKSVTLCRTDGHAMSVDGWSVAFCTGIESFVATNAADLSVGTSAFAGCTALRDISLGAGYNCSVTVRRYACSAAGPDTFFDETNQEDVAIPTNVCSRLVSVTLCAPNADICIDAFAFAGCSEISNVVATCCDMGLSVSSGAFDGCGEICLTMSGLAWIDESACEPNATFGGLASWQDWYVSLRLPENAVNLGTYAFSGCSKLMSVYFPGNAPTVDGMDARDYPCCLDLTDVPSDATVYVQPLSTGWGTVPGLFCGQMPMLYDCEMVEVGGQTLSYIRGDDGIWIVRGKHSCEFSGDFEIPATIDGLPVTRITDQAFAGSSYLGRITIPESVTHVVASAFNDCPSLAALVFEGDAPTFDSAELPCPVLVHRGSSGWQVTIPGRYLGADITYIEDGLGNRTGTDANGWTWEYEELLSGGVEVLGTPSNLCGRVSVPALIGGKETKAISASLFAGNARVIEVSLPSTVGEVPESAFERCTRLKTLTLAEGTCAIGDSAFRECVSLTNVVIPASVTNIGYFAFRDCLRLEQVTLLGNAPHRDLGVFMGVPAFTTVSGRLGAATAIVYAEVTNKTDEITVPETWLEELAVAHETPAGSATYEEAFEKKFGSDLKAALLKETGKHDLHGNPLHVWQDYVAGTDPLDEDDVFTATVTMENGVPKVSWNPQLTPEQAARRRYVTYGATALGGGWTDVSGLTDAQRQEQGYQFFRVTVEMK